MRRGYSSSTVFMALACFGAALCPPASAVDDLRLVVGAGSEVVPIGGSVSVFLRATNLSSAINGVQVRLSYDTSLMTLVSIIPIDLQAAGLVSPPAAGWMEVFSTDIGGQIDWAAIVTSGDVIADNTVARFMFTATAEGVTTVSFRADAAPLETKLTVAADSSTVLPSTLPSNSIVLGLPAVNLVWSPSAQLVQVGEIARFDLVAVAATTVEPSVSSVSAILNWNSSLVELVGHTDTGPFAWSLSGFPDDSGLDGLNAPFNGVTVDNDGDALYQAFANFAFGAPVTVGGLIVTSFDFRALSGTAGTQILIAPLAGSFSSSNVLGAGPIAGVNITGSLGTATLQIDECTFDAECDDGNVCTDDACNGGICVNTNNFAACDDGLFCTDLDVCLNGTCVGGSDPCFAPLLCSEPLEACVECLFPATCDDGNLCTDSVCDALGVCRFVGNTAPCDDGVFCTAVDVCSGGVCVAGGDTCPGRVCDEPGDRCVECLGDPDCDDSNGCTDDFCVANLCQNTNNTDTCDDGLFCTAIDLCVNGSCSGSINPCVAPTLCDENFNACVECIEDADCEDGNPCTTDTCPFTICIQTNNILPCDDGIFCTATDTCSGGACVGLGDTCPGELCDEPNEACVGCFTVADCPDDGIACTVDACVAGTCVYPISNALCDDGLFCNGAETCSGTVGCQAGTGPCDDSALCVEANEICGCQTPVVVAEGSRYIQVAPPPGNTKVALRVTGVDPEVACVSLWVQTNGTLGPDPVFKRPGGVNGWQIAHVRGLEVIPSTTYTVEAQCDTGAGLAFSAPTNATTWLWADADNSGPPIVIRDILLIISGFAGVFNEATLFAVDLWGDLEPCLPQRTIEIGDALRAIDAFAGLPYPCDIPCP